MGNDENRIVLEFDLDDAGFRFDSNIETALSSAQRELEDIELSLSENLETVKKLMK